MIDEINIRRLDLTVLTVFERLLERRNMSAVAIEMGLTQSAISHAVGRLRTVFGDPLFVRKGAGVEPTARALLLGPPLKEAIAGIRDAVRIGRHFDPATAARRFAVAAPDTIIATLAPAMLADVAQAAPLCRIMFRTVSPDQAAAEVACGDVDLAVGVFANPPKETLGKPLRQEGFRVVARAAHPHISKRLDLDTYCALGHLLVSHSRDARGLIDNVLDALGRKRRVVAIMPQLLVAFAAASRSDMIITAPESACYYAASIFPVDLHALPTEIPALQLSVLSHRDGRADPAIAWLIERVTQALLQERAPNLRTIAS